MIRYLKIAIPREAQILRLLLSLLGCCDELITFRVHRLRHSVSWLCARVHTFLRKSAIGASPAYKVKVRSKAEINDIYREESEGAQGSS